MDLAHWGLEASRKLHPCLAISLSHSQPSSVISPIDDDYWVLLSRAFISDLEFMTLTIDSSSTHFPVLGDVRNLDLPDSKLLVFPETPLTCLLICIISFSYRSIWAFEGSRPSMHICWVVLAFTSSCFIALTDVLAQTMTLIGSSSLFQQRKRLRCSGRRHSGTQAPIKN